MISLSTNPILEHFLVMKPIKPVLSNIHSIESVVSYSCNVTAVDVGEFLSKHTIDLLANNFFNHNWKEIAEQCDSDYHSYLV